MAVSAGRRLGSYEIVSAIGAGGMGEVYRARDTKLKREVALKVLPDADLWIYDHHWPFLPTDAGWPTRTAYPVDRRSMSSGTPSEEVGDRFEELKRLVPVK
jgi:serine/threonine protein kinase